MFDIYDLAWQHASTFTEEAEKRQVLEWFVERVRAGKTVNSAVMEFIAAGVEQHLAGKKPWGAKQGKKKRSVEQEMRDALPIYTEHKRIWDTYKVGDLVDPKQSVTDTAENLCISEDTVKRAIAIVNERRWTAKGRLVYAAWELEQFFLRWVISPEGKAFLETPEGREMYKDSPFINWIGKTPTLNTVAVAILKKRGA